MPITLSGDGSISGLTATGISAVQNLPAGAIIQVVGANNTLSNTTTTSTSPVSLGLTATITPKFSNSTIYIMATFSMTMDNQDNIQSYVYVYRNGSNLKNSGTALAMYDTPGGNVGFSIPISHYDSPATTSACTYTIYGSVGSSSSQFRPVAGTDTIVLMEVAA